MSVGSDGETMSVDERVEDIGWQYVFDSSTYKNYCDLRDDLAIKGMH